LHHAKLLIVDDERAIVDMMTTVLKKEGFLHIDHAYNGEDALEACKQTTYDLILLDIMMPGLSGLQICPFIRQTTTAPILFITAKSSDLDVLTGFAVGGDDYIRKPFNPLEVVARIQAQLQRYLPKGSSDIELAWRDDAAQSTAHATAAARADYAPHVVAATQAETIYDFGHFLVNETTAALIVDGKDVHCPALVFQLLLFLCKHPNRVFSKSELYERVWGESMINDDNTVMVHIHRIRERIERDPAKPQFLVNVRGIGYKLLQLQRPRSGGIDAS